MVVYNLVSVDTVISKAMRDGLSSLGFNESDVVEMIGEALAFIGAYAQYKEKVSFVDVVDHKAELPSGLQEIVMVAFSDKPVDAQSCLSESWEVNNYDTAELCNDCNEEDFSDDGVCWSCQNKYYIPEQRYLDAIRDYPFVAGFTSTFYQNYRPITLNTSTFRALNGIHCDNCMNVGLASEESYYVDSGYIITDKQSGSICISYLSMPLDDNGYPMIPDDPSYMEAIVKYIKMKMSDSMFFNDPSPANEKRFSKYEADWHWYCKQAKNKAKMPQNLDEREILMRGNQRMVKLRKGYMNYFGNNTLERFRPHGSDTGRRT